MKSVTWLAQVGLVVLALTIATPCQAWQITISERVQSPPETPNTMLHLKVQELRKLIGGSRLQGEFADQITTVDVAANMDFDNWTPTWEFGEVGLSKVPRLQEIAEATGGYLDSIGTTQVAWLPREEYVLPAGSDGVILVRPADRQRLSRWLSSSNRGSASDYLLDAAKAADANAVLWLALDANGVISPQLFAQKLETVEALKNNKTAIETLSSLFGSLRGVQVTISGGTTPQAVLAFDFASAPTALEIVGKALLQEAMTRRDVLLPNWDQWSSSISGNSLLFTGPIEAETVDNLLSLFTLHNEAKSIQSSIDIKKKADESQGDIVAMSTKQYFDSVNSIVKRVDSYSAGSSGARAHWNDKMANQLDELPTLNVDQECLQYGMQVSELLRGSGNTIRQANIQAGAEKPAAAASGASTDNIAVRGGYVGGYGYGGWGGAAGYQYNNYYDTTRKLAYDRNIDAQARAKGYSTYREAMTQIQAMSGDMRRMMTEKYKIQF